MTTTDDLWNDAQNEMLLDRQYEEHEGHYQNPDSDCWICVERAAEDED
jgi:hypothetical protein